MSTCTKVLGTLPDGRTPILCMLGEGHDQERLWWEGGGGLLTYRQPADGREPDGADAGTAHVARVEAPIGPTPHVDFDAGLIPAEATA